MSLATIVVLICEGLLIMFALYLVFSWLTQTPFYPSSPKALENFLKDLDIKVTNQTKFVDIGSGDGRFVVWAAQKGMLADGIEYNPFLTLVSRVKLLVQGLNKRAKIVNGDFFKQNYSKYNIAYMYLFNEHMDKLKDKLFAEMPKGSTIITNTFTFSNLDADMHIGKFYLYKVK